MNTQWLLAVAALMSAFAALLGVIIAGWNASRQIRATVVSANRQRWLDAIRENVADLLSQVWALSNHQKIVPTREASEDFKKTRFDFHDGAVASLYKLRVLLNAGDQQHQELLTTLESYVYAMKVDRDMESSIARSVQKIVATEMKKMKRGE